MKITGYRTFMQRAGDRPRLLLAIDTDEGITGWGECYDHGPDKALIPLLDYCFEQVQGHDPRRIEFLILKLLQHARFPPGALGLAAIAAIDHCLWDISGKAAGLPVFMLLGGHARERVRVYQGVRSGPDVQEALDQVLALNEKWGFTAFKMRPFKTDLHALRWGEVVKASADFFAKLRERAPSHFEFAFDGHAQIFEPYQAVQLGNALAAYDPLFFEEPIRPEHIPAWGRLRAQLNCPLATGECLYSRFEFLDLLSHQGADIIQPDICAVGGLLEMRKIAAIAEAHYVTVAPHNPMGPLATAHNVHFCAAQPNLKILEYRLPLDVSWIKDPYLPKDGYLELRHDRPGWGVEVDEAALATDDYVRWERALPRRPDGSTGYA
ncbi:MAG: mandelate racemase/muconate lactonizing enzyme family protein [Pseudomonadota bacterium]